MSGRHGGEPVTKVILQLTFARRGQRRARQGGRPTGGVLTVLVTPEHAILLPRLQQGKSARAAQHARPPTSDEARGPTAHVPRPAAIRPRPNLDPGVCADAALAETVI